MKWKILFRFLLILVVSVIIVFYIDVFLIYKFFTADGKIAGEWSRIGDFSLRFEQYIFQEDGSPTVTKEGMEQLNRRDAWIQILDEEGYEVYQWNKPEKALDHYTPSEMVYYNIYTGAIDGYTTFAGTAKINGYRWSYIIGFPMDKVAKYNFTYSPEKTTSNIFEISICLLLVPIVVLIGMGYLFGRSLTKPVMHMIQGIQELSKGQYDKKYPEKGLYKDVYRSLNHLSDRLKANEIERQNMEKMRGEWIQNLSHDLKTPLASIKGYGEFMADEEYDLTGEEIKKYSRIIQEKAEYMEKLIEDLKLTQILKKDLMPIRREEKDLVEVLRNVAIDVLNNPHYHNRKISFEPKREKIIFSFDESLLQRAFTNLIYNAIVHNDEDTEIVITIDQRDKISVEIADNGRGISKEDLEKLFERYYRGTNTGESHKGSGLGMAIAKQIIELHGGKITAESALGVGTRIIVTF